MCTYTWNSTSYSKEYVRRLRSLMMQGLLRAQGLFLDQTSHRLLSAYVD